MAMIDFYAFLGCFPFRDLPHSTAEDVVGLMDANLIERAAVTPFEAVYGRDFETANRRLAETISSHLDRFTQLAVLHPEYAGCLGHLRDCFEHFGVKGVRLFPNYHDYGLNGTDSHRLIAAVVDRGGLIHLPVQVQDWRQLPPYVHAPNVPVAGIRRVAERFPEGVFVMGAYRPQWEGPGWYEVWDETKRAFDACPNLHFDLSAAFMAPRGAVGHTGADVLTTLVESIGAERLLFATRLPLIAPAASRLELEWSTLDEATKHRIAVANANRLLASVR